MTNKSINDHSTPLAIFIAAIRHLSNICSDDSAGYGLSIALANFEKECGIYETAPDMIAAIQLLLTSHDNGDIQGEARGWIALRKARQDATT